MYGLILENMCQYTTRAYGSAKWEEIRKLANIKEPVFSIHKIYPDNYIPRLTSYAVQVLNITENEFLYNVGVSFVSFVGVYGYDKILSILGRQFRDFLNGLDNLHEYLRFSYPRLKPPSYFCNNESDRGMTLHYRSKRKYFLWYTIGQIEEVGRHFYQTIVSTKVLSENYDGAPEEYYFILQLTFDNKAFEVDYQYLSKSWTQIRQESTQISLLPLKADSLFEIFPFCLVFDSELTIKAVGGCLQVVLPNLLGRDLATVFRLSKPKVGYNWHSILGHLNSIFELDSNQPLKRDTSKDYLNYVLSKEAEQRESIKDSSVESNEVSKLSEEQKSYLSLKGQMLYMEEWKSMVYLASPNIADVDAMIRTGLYLNDLSLHDFSRDMVLAGQQQTAELKLALDQELHKSKQLEDSMIKLDKEMKRTDELLQQMRIVERLRKGENPIDTCQYFPCITILFSDIVNFTVICSRITPMQVVNMLNSMYSLFDELTERHKVYKVETIGDAYMICSGGGILDNQDNINHAHKVCEMALDMIRVVFTLRDPSSGNNLNIRIGVHTGAVVGGIVGMKMPRYCLFGDTVNTASRIESSSEAQMVQISEMTKVMLDPKIWDIYERGTIQLKGKGFMKTYWLYGRKDSKEEQIEMEQQLERIDKLDRSGKEMILFEKVDRIRFNPEVNLDQQLESYDPQIHKVMNNNYEKTLNELIKIKLDGKITDKINLDKLQQPCKTVDKSSSKLTNQLKNQTMDRNVFHRQNAISDKQNVINNSLAVNTTRSSLEQSISSESINEAGRGCFPRKANANSHTNRHLSCNLS